jgi:hypothetical protein
LFYRGVQFLRLAGNTRIACSTIIVIHGSSL